MEAEVRGALQTGCPAAHAAGRIEWETLQIHIFRNARCLTGRFVTSLMSMQLTIGAEEGSISKRDIHTPNWLAARNRAQAA